MDSFASLRVARGDPEAALEPVALAARFHHRLERLASGGGRETLILHPFLMLDEAWSAEVRRLLESIADLARAGRMWVASGGAFADWLGHRRS
jgi:hypothetical protein